MTGSLETEIDALAGAGDAVNRDRAREAFARLRVALSSGEVRAAEPAADAPAGWRVNAWVKRGILLGFRVGETIDVTVDHGRGRSSTKTRCRSSASMSPPACVSCPAARACATARTLEHASSACRRCTSISARMSAMDRWSIRTPSSVRARRSDARVHVSAAAQIGGVLEPVGRPSSDRRRRRARLAAIAASTRGRS